MNPLLNFGIISLIPALAALALAFVTREAVFSLLIGCLAFFKQEAHRAFAFFSKASNIARFPMFLSLLMQLPHENNLSLKLVHDVYGRDIYLNHKKSTEDILE